MLLSFDERIPKKVCEESLKTDINIGIKVFDDRSPEN